VDRSFCGDLLLEYTKKRDWICGALAGGTFPLRPLSESRYVLATVSFLPGRNTKEKTMFLLQQTGVARVPREASFHNGGGKDLVRFGFAKADQELQDACCRLESLSSKLLRNVASPRSLARETLAKG